MGFLNTIVEFEGPVVDIRSRCWAAHRQAIEAIGYTGPTETEFWRLYRLGEADSAFAPLAKPAQVAEYTRLRDERLYCTELMELDEAQPGAGPNLRILKEMGACHLASLGSNREGINATLDRLDLWIHFAQKLALPEDRERRVAAIRKLMGESHSTLALAGTVPFAYAANEAGARVVGIKGGPAFSKRLRQVGVDVFFDSLDKLTDALAARTPEIQRLGLIY